MSSATIFLFLSPSGTSCRTIRWASPSTTAVLPTPGSPISTGLFLVRRESTWIDAADLFVAADDRIELAFARELGEVAAVLLERLVGALGVLRGHALVPRTEVSAWRIASLPAPNCCSTRVDGALRPVSPASASSRCSVLT